MENKVVIVYDHVLAMAGCVGMIAFPHGWKSLIPGYDIYKGLIEPLAKKIIENANLNLTDDIENIKEIIKSGKENGVDELDLIISKELGIDIRTNLENIGIPCNVKFKIGKAGETTIKVKYK